MAQWAAPGRLHPPHPSTHALPAPALAPCVRLSVCSCAPTASLVEAAAQVLAQPAAADEGECGAVNHVQVNRLALDGAQLSGVHDRRHLRVVLVTPTPPFDTRAAGADASLDRAPDLGSSPRALSIPGRSQPRDASPPRFPAGGRRRGSTPACEPRPPAASHHSRPSWPTVAAAQCADASPAAPEPAAGLARAATVPVPCLHDAQQHERTPARAACDEAQRRHFCRFAPAAPPARLRTALH
eukprot:CAMPEP_0183378392 /NCGR_PEP_ID=MMETSP0164_2-20130417/124890_1 /TAXON_ID=221442 /ORGANISM="Coccolithus pelagicus ssp braarudi, Strain PLY182g" /LENGTH=240 /DNA_ID=CAMNT_0025555947 /DNA_START=259 /DNA_END=982 /DNA_ORIENTATION=+